MLPDWPDIKEEIARAFMRHAAEKVRQRSVAGIVVAIPVHEGHGHFIQRADGNTEERAFERADAEVAIPADAIKSESLGDIFNRMEPIIETLAGATSQTMFKVMEEGTRAVGNEVNAGGQPLSAELILEAWEKVHIDFDAAGQPQWPTMVIGPMLQDRLISELTRLDSDPELRRRRDTLVMRKREEWRARE